MFLQNLFFFREYSRGRNHCDQHVFAVKKKYGKEGGFGSCRLPGSFFLLSGSDSVVRK